MNRYLLEYLRCIINGKDNKFLGWSTDVKLFSLAYNSQLTTTLGLSPYDIVFNQKQQKPIKFIANSSKNAQGYCQPTKDSNRYNLPLHTHNEHHFHHPQTLKLASGSHTKLILNRDKKHHEIHQKLAKNFFTNTEYSITNKYTFHTATNIKVGNI